MLFAFFASIASSLLRSYVPSMPLKVYLECFRFFSFSIVMPTAILLLNIFSSFTLESNDKHHLHARTHNAHCEYTGAQCSLHRAHCLFPSFWLPFSRCAAKTIIILPFINMENWRNWSWKSWEKQIIYNYMAHILKPLTCHKTKKQIQISFNHLVYCESQFVRLLSLALM